MAKAKVTGPETIEASKIHIEELGLLPPSEAEIDALAEDIRTNGLQAPVIIDQWFNLLDGRKRLRALARLGATVVPAYKAHTVDEAAVLLKAARGDRVYAPHDIWVQYEGLERLFSERRSERQRGRRKGAPSTGVPSVQSRMVMADIAGTNSNIVSGSASLHRIAKAGDPVAMGYVLRVAAKEMSLSSAMGKLRGEGELTGVVTQKQEQIDLLNGIVTALRSAAQASRRLGQPVKVPPEQVKEIVAQLYKERTTLTKFINILRRDPSNEEE